MSRLSRRQVLRGLGGFSLALPCLPSLLLPHEARAAPSQVPKRFLAVGNYNGGIEQVYYPSATPVTSGGPDVLYKPLSEFEAGRISEVFDSKFDALKSKLNIYRGLDIPGVNDHDAVHMLCGTGKVSNDDGIPRGTGASIDSLMMNSTSFYPTLPQYSAIYTQDGIYSYGMSFTRDLKTGAVTRPPHSNSPADLFESIFGTLVLQPDVAAQFKAKKVKIGDLVLEQYKALRGHRRISAADKITLENFVTQVQDLNTRINQAPTQRACTKPTLGTVPHYFEQYTESDWETFWGNHTDIIVTAMACDMTRIGTLMVNLFGYDHGLSHSDGGDRNNQLAYLGQIKHVAKIFVDLATKMNAFVEADGTTMLDNSIIHWGTEHSLQGAHSCLGLPSASLGGAGGKLKTGYYLDYRMVPHIPHPDQGPSGGFGRGYSQLLVTYMRAMGLQPADYLGYGDGGGFGLYDLNASYSNGVYEKYQSERNNPLPFVSRVG